MSRRSLLTTSAAAFRRPEITLDFMRRIRRRGATGCFSRLECASSATPQKCLRIWSVLASLGSSSPSGDVGFGFSANPNVAFLAVIRANKAGVAIGATRLKTSFGTGIKEPEMHEAFSPNVFFLGNPALNPERAISFEAGVVQEFANRRASLELTYFDNRFRDLIIFEFDPVTFGPIKLPDGRLT